MAKAKKLPSGSWRALVYVGLGENGKRKYKSITAPTEAEANMLASRMRYDLERGAKLQSTPEDLTVAEAVAQYIREREKSLSPKTAREYETILRNHYAGIKNIKLKKLTERAVKLEMTRESVNLSPKSIRNIYGLLKSTLDEFAPDLNIKIKMPKKEMIEMQIPTNEELFLIFEKAENTSLELPVLLAATCGLRRGEICAIDLNTDVDYDNCKLSIKKAVAQDKHGEWITKSPKSAAGKRIIDCPAWVVDELRQARDRGYKFPKPSVVTNAFMRLKNRYGLSIRFHDLRHYYASVMLSLGVPDKYAMARMGHATPNMLKNVYQHLMDDKNREITEQMNGFFDSVQHEMQHDLTKERENERKTSKNKQKKEI